MKTALIAGSSTGLLMLISSRHVVNVADFFVGMAAMLAIGGISWALIRMIEEL